VHLVGFRIRIYQDAWSNERQISQFVNVMWGNNLCFLKQTYRERKYSTEVDCRVSYCYR